MAGISETFLFSAAAYELLGPFLKKVERELFSWTMAVELQPRVDGAIEPEVVVVDFSERAISGVKILRDSSNLFDADILAKDAIEGIDEARGVKGLIG